MSRPITNSSQIRDELNALNAKVDRIISTLPNQPQQISDEQKAVLTQMGIPIPEPIEPEDPMLNEIKSISTMVNLQGVETSQFINRYNSDINTVNKQIQSLNDRITGVVWGIVIALLVYFALNALTISGCQSNPKPRKDQEQSAIVITMDEQDYNLVRTAVNHVVRDIDSYDSLDTAFNALYAEMPVSVRDQMIGTVKKKIDNLDDMPNELQSILNTIIIRRGAI